MGMRVIPVFVSVFVLASCGGEEQAQSAASPGSAATEGSYEAYANQQLGVQLLKPAGWSVFAQNGTLTLEPAPEGPTAVFVHPFFSVAASANSTTFLRALYEQTRQDHPDVAIVSKRSSPDGALAELVVSMKHRPSGTPVKALYLLSMANGQGVLSGYQALPEQFDGVGAVFRTVLKDLKVDAAAFSSAAGKQAVDGAKKKTLPPTIDVRTLRITPSDDRTMYLAVPPDWHVGGGNVSLVATSPDGQMGITATHDHQPRTFDVVAYFNECLMPFYRCTKTTIRKHEPNKEFIQSQRGIGTSTYAENFEGRTVNGDGVTVDFAIMVYATQAAPRMGYVGTLGFYATPELYERNWVPLYCMAASMHPDTNKIMATLRENLDRLGAASRTISQAGDVVIAGIESSTANVDRALDKFNYYLSGEEARYSPLENRVYVVDSSVGEYAVNPRYPQERLRDVPDRLWNQLPHERQPD